MKNKKKSGFILAFTVTSILIVGGIFYLLGITLKNKVSVPFFYENRKIMKSNLKSISAITFLEFKKADEAIASGKVKNFFEYVTIYSFLTETSPQIYLWTNEETRKSASIGGYSIYNTSPLISTLTFDGRYQIGFTFSKKFALKNSENNNFMNVEIRSGTYIVTYCNFTKANLVLVCDPFPSTQKINNFRVNGEAFDEK